MENPEAAVQVVAQRSGKTQRRTSFAWLRARMMAMGTPEGCTALRGQAEEDTAFEPGHDDEDQDFAEWQQ